MSRLYFLSTKRNAPNYTLNALISAALCAIPFTFPQLFFTAWVGLVPFFASLMSEDFFAPKGKKAFFTGYKYGFFYCSMIYYWFCRLYPLDFAGFTPLAALATVAVAWFGISAFQALIFGLGTLVWRVADKKSPVLLAVIFTLCEFSWHFGELAMPWCKIGITQYKFLPFIQSSALFGSLFISFVLYAVNALLCRGVKHKKCLAAAMIIFFANLLYGSVMLNVPVSYTDKADFALIQGNIPSSEKWYPGSTQDSFDTFRDLSVTTAQKQDIDFTVWPESAVPVSMYSAYTRQFLETPDLTDSVLLTGAFGYKDEKSTNSLFMLDENGISDTFYTKRHLVPFGEYLPYRSVFELLLPFVADINMLSGDLYEGSTSEILTTDKGNIGALICFDSIFPDLCAKSVRDGAQMMVLITNDSWYFDSAATSQHLAQAVFRAVENRRSVARCANTGISALIDERGRIKEQLGAMQTGCVTGSLGFTDAHTLYTYIGDLPMYASAIYIIIILIRRIKKWKSKPSTSEKTIPQ